jgi:hypothetical protein
MSGGWAGSGISRGAMIANLGATNQVIAAASQADLVLPDTVWDTDGYAGVQPNRLVVPPGRGGLYLVTASASIVWYFAATSGSVQGQLFGNPAGPRGLIAFELLPYQQFPSTAYPLNALNVTTVAKLTAGTVIEWQIYNGLNVSVQTQDVNNSSYYFFNALALLFLHP